MIIRLLIFLIINFGALAVGGLFTDPMSNWYTNLNKAPWTPPGWFFGVAWTTIMLCFSVYMALLWDKVSNKTNLLTLYVVQLILNIIWNPIFFSFHWVLVGLLVIGILTALIGFMLNKYRNTLGWLSALLLPYFLWLVVATSLNLYVLLMN